MKIFAFILCLVLAFVIADELDNATIIPHPTTLSKSHQYTVSITAFKPSFPKSAVLSSFLNKYQKYVFFPQPVGDGGALPLLFHIQDSQDTVFKVGVDESYALDISNKEVTVKAGTIWGAMHACKSLAQLMQYDSATKTYHVINAPVNVVDSPRFPWREVLLDVSRHFLSLDSIKTVITGMSASKYNVLHLHLVDAESWPLEIRSYPNMTAGAYAPEAIYTQKQITEIIDFANSLGLMVLPEIDTPGHAASWGTGYPGITAKCPQRLTRLPNIPLNPADKRTIPIMKAIIQEVSQLFSSGWFHIGGDEVVKACWTENEEIAKWMKDNNFSSAEELYRWFLAQSASFASTNSNVVIWGDGFSKDIGLSDDVVVHAWRDPANIKRALEAGYRSISSCHWYLDQHRPDPQDQHYLLLDVWEDYYVFDPMETIKDLTDAQKENFLGGGAAQWGEQINDFSVIPRIFPRSGAVAERLWSPAHFTDVVEMRARMIKFSCDLIQKYGVGATPLRADYCPSFYLAKDAF